MTVSAAVLIFGAVVLVLAGVLISRGERSSTILRVFGTILIIITATFLVVVGYDNAQLGAPLGLLGTIAGYILGKDASDRGTKAMTDSRSEP